MMKKKYQESLEKKGGLFLIQEKKCHRQQVNLQKVYSKGSRDRDRESIADMYPLMKFCISGYSRTVQRRKNTQYFYSFCYYAWNCRLFSILNENSISDQIRDMLVCDKLKVPSTWGLTCSWPTSSNYLH